MSDMNSIYRQVIMDHYKNPRNKGLKKEEGYVLCHLKNPSCGDMINVESKTQNGMVADIRQDGQGCSICCASASIISETLKGKSVKEALNIIDNYLKMVSNEEYDKSIDLDELAVFEGIKDFPARVRCASIAAQALKNTLEKEEKNA